MTIRNFAKDRIDVYTYTATRDSEGGPQKVYTHAGTVNVMWLGKASTVDTSQKREHVQQRPALLTDDPDVFELLKERGTVVVYDGQKYQVDSKKDCANMHRVFGVWLSNSTVSDLQLIGGVVGGGA